MMVKIQKKEFFGGCFKKNKSEILAATAAGGHREIRFQSEWGKRIPPEVQGGARW
jgi:hypothetical protein